MAYSLITFTTGTVISSSQMNSNFSTIQTALNSAFLAANGSVPMTASLALFAGTALLPGLIFNGSTATGWYSNSGNWSYRANGVSTDSIQFNSDGSITHPTKVNLNGAIDITTNSTTTSIQYYQCYFQYTSVSVCTLLPYNGNLLFINGQNYVIPSAGVTLSSGSVSGGYNYVYATANASGVISLAGSSTAPSFDTTYGVYCSGGTPANGTLVGAVYYSGGFFDSADNTSAPKKLVLSYFNRRKKTLRVDISSGPSIGAGTGAGTALNQFIDFGYISTTFICWANESAVFTQHYSEMAGSTTNQHIYVGMSIDSSSTANTAIGALVSAGSTNSPSFNITYKADGLTENTSHAFRNMGATDSGQTITGKSGSGYNTYYYEYVG